MPERSFSNINQPNLKSVKKQGKVFNKTFKRAKRNVKVELKHALKSGEVHLAKGQRDTPW